MPIIETYDSCGVEDSDLWFGCVVAGVRPRRIKSSLDLFKVGKVDREESNLTSWTRGKVTSIRGSYVNVTDVLRRFSSSKEMTDDPSSEETRLDSNKVLLVR
jgi:hypothetical protein